MNNPFSRKIITSALCATIAVGVLMSIQPSTAMAVKNGGVNSFLTGVCAVDRKQVDQIKSLLKEAFPKEQYNTFFAAVRTDKDSVKDMCTMLKPAVSAYQAGQSEKVLHSFLRSRALAAMIISKNLSEQTQSIRWQTAAKDLTMHERGDIQNNLKANYTENLALAGENDLDATKLSRSNANYLFDSFSPD